jgi:hypothetical protein
VLLTLALALVLAAWLPQMSALGADDVTWQTEMLRRFGSEGWMETARPFLRTLGVFRLADATGIHVLLALLALTLLARLVDSVEGLWQGRPGGGLPEELEYQAVDEDWAELVARLRRQRMAVAEDNAAGPVENGAEQPQIARADRWPWGELGVVLVYLGGLLLLASMAFTALWSWRIESLSIAAGESVPLEHGSGLTLQLEELSQDGRRGAGKIWRGETAVGAGEVAVGRPLRGGGVGVHLVGNGAGLRVRASLSDTLALELAAGSEQAGQTELLLTFNDDETRQSVGVPDAGLVLFLTMPQSAPQSAQGSVQPWVQVLESGSGQFILEQNAPDGAPLTVGGVSFVLTPVPCARVRVTHDPGVFWSQLGLVLLLAGLVLWGRWPPRRLWLWRLAGSDDEPDKVKVAGDVQGLVRLDAQDE